MHNGKKSALITGAAGGLGHAMVKAFRDAGYRVIATDIVERPKYLVCDHYIKADLCRYAEENAYANQINAILNDQLDGGLDVLINNAAIQILGKADLLTRQDWRTTLDVNLLAPFFLIQSMISVLENVHGCVINIGSIHARLTKQNFVAYATSKAAMAGMTRALAIDFGARIRVNAIEPGALETNMLLDSFSKHPELYQELSSCHPIGRIGYTQEIASAALWLASEECSFIHGECIRIDGGISNRLHDPD